MQGQFMPSWQATGNLNGRRQAPRLPRGSEENGRKNGLRLFSLLSEDSKCTELLDAFIDPTVAQAVSKRAMFTVEIIVPDVVGIRIRQQRANGNPVELAALDRDTRFYASSLNRAASPEIRQS